MNLKAIVQLLWRILASVEHSAAAVLSGTVEERNRLRRIRRDKNRRRDLNAACVFRGGWHVIDGDGQLGLVFV